MIAAVAVLAPGVGLSGCSLGVSVPADAWRLEPVVVDHSTETDRSDPSDVSYILDTITSDGAGGFWTESAGSWFHIGPDGETLARFNRLNGDPDIHSLTALAPTTLVAAGPAEMRGGSDLYIFDTEAQTMTPAGVLAARIGDVTTTTDGEVLFVEYVDDAGALGSGVPFVVRSWAPDGSQRIVLGPDAGLRGAEAALAAAPDGTFIVATDQAVQRVHADGSFAILQAAVTENPMVDVNSEGDVLIRSSVPGGLGEEGVLVGGTERARSIVESHQRATSALAMITPRTTRELPFAASAITAVWVTPDSFVFVVPGSGDESTLVLATAPGN